MRHVSKSIVNLHHRNLLPSPKVIVWKRWGFRCLFQGFLSWKRTLDQDICCYKIGRMNQPLALSCLHDDDDDAEECVQMTSLWDNNAIHFFVRWEGQVKKSHMRSVKVQKSLCNQGYTITLISKRELSFLQSLQQSLLLIVFIISTCERSWDLMRHIWCTFVSRVWRQYISPHAFDCVVERQVCRRHHEIIRMPDTITDTTTDTTTDKQIVHKNRKKMRDWIWKKSIYFLNLDDDKCKFESASPSSRSMSEVFVRLRLLL